MKSPLRMGLIALVVAVALTTSVNGQTTNSRGETARLGPNFWIENISLFGPSALLVFFVFVTERKIYGRMKVFKEMKKEARILRLLYCANWVVIALLVICALVVWFMTHMPPKEYTIRGKITNLRGAERIEGEGNLPLFLSRAYKHAGKSFDYLWRLPTTSRLADGKCARYNLVYFKGASEEDIDVRVLTIEPWFYHTPEVLIEYNRAEDKFYLTRGSDKQRECIELPLYSPPISVVSEPTSVGFSLVSTANAQSRNQFDTNRFRAGLESDKPSERYAARAALAKQGKNAMLFIRDVLADPRSSYRLQVGVMTGLVDMKSVSLDALGVEAIVWILTHAATDTTMKADSTLHDLAIRFVTTHNPELRTYVERVINSGPGGTGHNAARKALELLGGSRLQTAKYPRRLGLDIPDGDPRGISDELQVDVSGELRTLRVVVRVAHSHIGDLQIRLTAPSGEKVVLHNRLGGATHNIDKTYDSSQLPGLAALVGREIRGNWRLHVADLSARDEGVLRDWSIELGYVPFKESIVNRQIPDNDPQGVENVKRIEDEGLRQFVEVTVDIRHPCIGDLRVELFNPSGSSVILHNQTGGAGKDLYRKYTPDNTPQLALLLKEPIKGNWRLHVADLSARDVGVLRDWSIEFR